MVTARRTGTNENIQTFGGGTRDFTSVSAWETATDNDLVTAQQSEVLECFADSVDFPDTVIINGAITDATYMRIVRPAAGQFHDGTPNAGVKFRSTTSADIFQINEDNFKLQDLVFEQAINDAATFAAVDIIGGTGYEIVGCIAAGSTNAGAGGAVGFHGSAAATGVIVDCITGKLASEGFLLDLGTMSVYNCTSYFCTVGFSQTGGTMVLKNCLAQANFTEFSGAFDAASTNNIGFGTVGIGTGGLQLISRFADPSKSNFLLQDSDASGRRRGTDLSADGVFGFDDDVLRQVITNWPVGAHQPLEATVIPSRRTATNENISTYGGGSRDFTSLSLWESVTDNVLIISEVSEVLECFADSPTFDDNVLMQGASTNGNFYRIIRAAAGQGHSGTSVTGVIFLQTTGLPVRTIDVRENACSVQDIVVRHDGTEASDILCFSAEDGLCMEFVACIAGPSVNSGTGGTIGFNNAVNSTIHALCLAEAQQGNGFRTTGDTIYYNCHAIGSEGNGFNRSAGTAVAINCLGALNDADFLGTWASGSSNNASLDATAPGTSNRINQTFTFVDENNNDFHLALADLGARNFGTPLNVAVEFNFTDDIDKEAFQTWDIGFDEPGGDTAPAGPRGVVLKRRRRLLFKRS